MTKDEAFFGVLDVLGLTPTNTSDILGALDEMWNTAYSDGHTDGWQEGYDEGEDSGHCCGL